MIYFQEHFHFEDFHERFLWAFYFLFICRNKPLNGRMFVRTLVYHVPILFRQHKSSVILSRSEIGISSGCPPIISPLRTESSSGMRRGGRNNSLLIFFFNNLFQKLANKFRYPIHKINQN